MNKETISILYFASLGETLDCQQEIVPLDATISDIKKLKNQLALRGGRWVSIQSESIKCALNHEIVNESQPVKAGDEIAFFPPVTGG